LVPLGPLYASTIARNRDDGVKTMAADVTSVNAGGLYVMRMDDA
jgi:hypothetical protein